MQTHKIVSREEWIAARRALLEKEKAHLRAQDEIARQRRELPWVKVEKNYLFEGPEGRERSQSCSPAAASSSSSISCSVPTGSRAASAAPSAPTRSTAR